MCDCDIINDAEFSSSNELFSSVLVNLKKQGKGATQHKQPISPDDFNKLYTSDVLSTSHPAGLQNKVFIDIMMYLCNRGQENLRNMTKNDFLILTDSARVRYVSVVDKQTKNHQGQDDEDVSQQGRMYQLSGNPKCPVLSFEKYIAKLNSKLDCFWQKPTTKAVTEETVRWYENVPIGANTLITKMKVLSVEANLSAIYTNHCLRATCITALDQAGFEARHIMTLSGQKSEASIRSCSRNVSDDMRRDMSLTLSTHVGHKCTRTSNTVSDYH